METNKTEEYLNEIRAIDGLQNAILTGITVYKREMAAEFTLITDKAYTALSEERAKKTTVKYLPPSFSPRIRIVKRVPDREILKKRIYEFMNSRFPAAAAFLKEEDIEVEMLQSGANFCFDVASGEQSLFTSGRILDEVSAYLKSVFCGSFYGNVRIVEKEVCGGLVNWTHTVENVPSYKSIHGMDLMTACREHAESLGVAIKEVNEVEEVRLDGQPKEIRTSEGDSFTADVVTIATGRKPIPLPVETAFEKVHYCSVCDGTAYKDKDVLVVGGGNSGFDESLYLAGLGVRSVHIVEMFPACAAAQSTQDRALATGIIRANVNTTITALDPLPDGRCRASLRDTASGAASEETVDGVFCFIGQKPNTALFEGLIDMEKGYIRTDEDMRTSLPGVFAVGDVRAKRYRQITTAMGDGTVAALEAERFIRSLR